MDNVDIDGRLYTVVEEKEETITVLEDNKIVEKTITIPVRIEDEDGIHEVIDWNDNGVKAFSLIQKSADYLRREAEEKEAQRQANEMIEAAQLSAKDAEFDEMLRARGLIQ